jgi:hypothetical protein
MAGDGLSADARSPAPTLSVLMSWGVPPFIVCAAALLLFSTPSGDFVEDMETAPGDNQRILAHGKKAARTCCIRFKSLNGNPIFLPISLPVFAMTDLAADLRAMQKSVPRQQETTPDGWKIQIAFSHCAGI